MIANMRSISRINHAQALNFWRPVKYALRKQHTHTQSMHGINMYKYICILHKVVVLCILVACKCKLINSQLALRNELRVALHVP